MTKIRGFCILFQKIKTEGSDIANSIRNKEDPPMLGRETIFIFCMFFLLLFESAFDICYAKYRIFYTKEIS